MRLTQERARTFILPEGRSETIIFDDQMPGFGLRVRAGGSRNWTVQYKVSNRHRRMTLGSIQLLNAEKARRTAQEVLANVRLGDDPQAIRSQKRTRSNRYLRLRPPAIHPRQEGRLRRQHLADTRRYLLRYARPLHDCSLTAIGRAEKKSA
jgi:hypothetical protein